MSEYKTGNMEFIDRMEGKNIMLREMGLRRSCARRRESNYTDGFLS